MRDSLDPAAEDVADLLVRMCREPWPTTEQERCDYFTVLGLHEQEHLPVRDDDPGSTSLRFATSLPGVDGICSAFRDEFLGLSLFCWAEQCDNGLQARAGHPALRDLLSRSFGTPTEEWGPTAEPACCWVVGPLTIEMYCFQRLQSSVMVGPSHSPLSSQPRRPPTLTPSPCDAPPSRPSSIYRFQRLTRRPRAA